MNLYISPFEYTKSATGQETASMIGNLGRIAAVSANTTALVPLMPLTAALNQYDEVYIFDGANSEIVTVGSAGAAINALSIPVSATAFSHAAGTVFCSDGVSGSIGNVLLQSSAMLENYCQQSLLQQTYTETSPLRTLSAAITNDGTLSIRTRHFPVTAISALTIETDLADVIALDPTQAIIPTRQRLINVPVLSQIGAGPSTLAFSFPLSQADAGFVNLTYTAGFAYGSLPFDIKQAAIWLTSDLLSDRLNPTGAADVQMGKRHVTVYLRGDVTGESALVKRAHAMLDPYRRQA